MTPSKNSISRETGSNQQSTSKIQAIKKVGIDMSKQIEPMSPINKDSNINNKNYGGVTEQIHHA